MNDETSPDLPSPPFVVSIGWPGMAMAGDWVYCETAEELQALIDETAQGARIDVWSVWSLVDVPADRVVLKS